MSRPNCCAFFCWNDTGLDKKDDCSAQCELSVGTDHRADTIRPYVLRT